MCDIVGYNRMKSKDGKEFAVVYYKTDRKITEGAEVGSVVCSVDYADKLISYCKSGGILCKGWNKEEKREFLYIPKVG